MPLENTDAEERITRETMIGWIEHWGESYDDVRPDDGAMRLANRIIEYNAATETIEALRNPDAVYDELASILQPVLSSMDGTYFAGSEWFAGEVDRMEADRINGEQPEETDGLASEEPRIPFIVESEATAADTDYSYKSCLYQVYASYRSPYEYVLWFLLQRTLYPEQAL